MLSRPSSNHRELSRPIGESKDAVGIMGRLRTLWESSSSASSLLYSSSPTASSNVIPTFTAASLFFHLPLLPFSFPSSSSILPPPSPSPSHPSHLSPSTTAPAYKKSINNKSNQTEKKHNNNNKRRTKNRKKRQKQATNGERNIPKYLRNLFFLLFSTCIWSTNSSLFGESFSKLFLKNFPTFWWWRSSPQPSRIHHQEQDEQDMGGLRSLCQRTRDSQDRPFSERPMWAPRQCLSLGNARRNDIYMQRGSSMTSGSCLKDDWASEYCVIVVSFNYTFSWYMLIVRWIR